MKMVDKLVWVSNGVLNDSFYNEHYLRGAPKPSNRYTAGELARMGIAGFYKWKIMSEENDIPIITSMQVQDYLPKELFEI